MFPHSFEFVRASTVDQAVALLAEGAGDARVVAGGHSLLPMMKLRMAQPSRLIDISAIPELSGISVSETSIRIGAAVRHADMIRHTELNAAAPIFGIAGNQIADRQVRNRGTIGGSIANADPSSDWPAVMALLDATFVIYGSAGLRKLHVSEFFHGVMQTDLQDDELLVQIELPRPKAGLTYAYRKFRHPASGYAVVGVAAAGAVRQGQVEACSIALTGLCDSAFAAGDAARHLLGKPADDAVAIRRASELAVEGRAALADSYASSEYRLSLARTLVERALKDVLA